MRLKDKAIIVTGSTTGIGRGIAERCVAEGARVLIHGLNEERAQEVAGALGEAAEPYVDDLADPEAPRRVIEAGVKAFGRLDGLVNNAAISPRATLQETTAELFDKIIAINLRAPLLAIRAAVGPLSERKGSVVNIGSVNGYCGEPALPAYSMSKGGLMTMSRNLGDTLHRESGIRVNHFNLGWILTENEYKKKLDDGLPAGWPDMLDKQTIPAGRMNQPEDVARHAVFWLSEDSQPVSGSTIDFEQFPVIGRNPPKETEEEAG